MKKLLTFIRFSHTVFAMPFALGAMFVAARGLPPWRVCGLIVLAMVLARTAAMVFNRLVDWEIDKRNPRTQARHRLVTRTMAVSACVASSVLFLITAQFINPLCFVLSPVALAIVFFYSLTKRFTHFTHVFLGLALAVAPVGAWIAVTGAFAWPPLVLAAAVVMWLTGFDVIYALQDYEVDKREKLHSLVVWLGPRRAVHLALAAHALAFGGLVAFGVVAALSWMYFAAMPLIFAAFVWEHILARRGDAASINKAFFQANAFVGTVFVVAAFLGTF